jgi:hypothetical protein
MLSCYVMPVSSPVFAEDDAAARHLFLNNLMTIFYLCKEKFSSTIVGEVGGHVEVYIEGDHNCAVQACAPHGEPEEGA